MDHPPPFALLAAIQLAVIFRGQMMIHWPQSRPLLADLCSAFRCTVNWPTQADRLAVMGTELQAVQGTDVLELSALIRNRAEFTQSLPAIEVTLTDARNRPCRAASPSFSVYPAMIPPVSNRSSRA